MTGLGDSNQDKKEEHCCVTVCGCLLRRAITLAYIVLHEVTRVHLLRKINNGCGRGELEVRPPFPLFFVNHVGCKLIDCEGK